MSITEAAAIIGAITGPSGLLVATLVYFRDRGIVEVFAQADMRGYGQMALPGATYYAVRITNVGRRAVYVSHVNVELPKGAVPNATHLAIGTQQGVTLAEGAAPHVEYANQAGMQRFAHVWWRIRATVFDTSGKRCHSNWLIEPPSWAGTTKAPFGAIAWNRIKNWGRVRVF